MLEDGYSPFFFTQQKALIKFYAYKAHNCLARDAQNSPKSSIIYLEILIVLLNHLLKLYRFNNFLWLSSSLSFNCKRWVKMSFSTLTKQTKHTSIFINWCAKQKHTAVSQSNSAIFIFRNTSIPFVYFCVNIVCNSTLSLKRNHILYKIFYGDCQKNTSTF